MRLTAVLLLAGCTSTVEFERVGEAVPQWTDLTAHPCALDDLGSIFCWTSTADPDYWDLGSPPEQTREAGAASLIENDHRSVLALDTSGRYLRVHCDYLGDACSADVLPGTYLAVSSGLAVGLTKEHRLDYGGRSFPNAPSGAEYFQVIDEAIVAGLDGQNRVHAIGDASVYPVSLSAVPLKLVLPTTNAGDACVLDDERAVTCVGAASEWPFVEGEWWDIDGWQKVMCGVRVEDDAIVCVDGYRDEEFTLEWGPIRKLAVRSRGYGGEVSLCAITERNELRCHGPVYDDAFHAELEAVNEVRRTPDPPERLPWR